MDIKVHIARLERNPYCYPNEGSSQIYTCRVSVKINYDDYYFDLRSGYNYSIDLVSFREITETRLKELNIAYKTINKFIKKHAQDIALHSYRSFDRQYQIQQFWNMLKDMDNTIDYQDYKTTIEDFKNIEDQARNAAIAKHLAENKVA